jgi:hypothetical protein
MEIDINKLGKDIQIGMWHSLRNDPMWVKAFDEYNRESNQRPISLNCIACYYKVFMFHKKKQS